MDARSRRTSSATPVLLLYKMVCRPALRASLVAIGALLFLLAAAAGAQTTRELAGDYAGEIEDRPATLHLRLADDGALTATMDHLDPPAPWMFTCDDVRLEGRSLSFTIESVHASWRGTLSADGRTLSGTWTEKGSSLFVSFVRQQFIPAAKPSAIDGFWLGTQRGGTGPSTRIQIAFRSDSAGREYCTVDVLDLYYNDLECANVIFNGGAIAFDVPTFGSHWSGELSADGNMLSGKGVQRMQTAEGVRTIETPLTLTRQAGRTQAKAKPRTTYDDAMPPVKAAEMQAVLDRDLSDALKSANLSGASGGGVSIGVYTHGTSRVFSYGIARNDSIYEIGSITKTFTGLLLAQMAAQGKVKLDEPVRELFPAGTIAKPRGQEITLLDLAAQRSGLPPMPDNLGTTNMDQPYADYHAADQIAYLARRGVANPNQASSEFGSLGFGLLGLALADRAKAPYGDLIKEEIAEPLGLKDTAVALSSEQRARLIPGRDEYHGPARPWDSDALAGAIAIRSTAADMLAYLVANLHPENVTTSATPAAASLPSALRRSQQLEALNLPGMQIGMGWLYENSTGIYWHNGATAAYSSYAFFNPKADFAAVVLWNESPGVEGSFAEVLARHIHQRLAGKPAISLH